MNINIVSTINGLGVVEAKNDLATFTLTLKSKDDSLEGAKRQIEEKTNDASKLLVSKNMKLDGEISTKFFNYKLEHREGSERYPAGFQSLSTITWTVAVDGSLDDIYKTCLTIDSHAARPVFSIKNRDVLREQALIKATENVKEKLAKECKLLGVNPEKLVIYNWNFGYEGFLESNRGMNNMLYNNTLSGVTGATGPSGLIGAQGLSYQPTVQKLGSIYQELIDYKQLEPGMVTVQVPVQVNYVWKAESTTSA